MTRPIKSGLMALVILFAAGVAHAASPVTPEVRLAKANQAISSMEKILQLFFQEVSTARNNNDIKKLNCLMQKLDLVKGFIKAAQSAKEVIQEASYGGDATIANTYMGKISQYSKRIYEVEKSRSECAAGSSAEGGNTLVYIRPGGEDIAGLGTDDESRPYDTTEFQSGEDAYPLVPPGTSPPPATPFQ